MNPPQKCTYCTVSFKVELDTLIIIRSRHHASSSHLYHIVIVSFAGSRPALPSPMQMILTDKLAKLTIITLCTAELITHVSLHMSHSYIQSHYTLTHVFTSYSTLR